MNPAQCERPHIGAAYRCGPVELKVTFEDSSLGDAPHGLLSQYDAPWPAPGLVIKVTIGRDDAPSTSSETSGAYFRSYLLRVERHGNRLISSSNGGVWMRFDFAAGEAGIAVPPHPDWPAIVEETEQQLVFLLARTW